MFKGASQERTLEASIMAIRHQLGERLPTRSLLERYRPSVEWFARRDGYEGIHGASHEARVLVWQEIISRLLIVQGVALNQEALRWAASTHDIRRLDDGYDFEHGSRSAMFVRNRLGEVVGIENLEVIAYLDEWHVPRDMKAPNMTTELSIFKDADGLDRARIGDLNPSLLRNEVSRLILVKPAEELERLSSEDFWRGRRGVFDSVMTASVQLGIVLDK